MIGRMINMENTKREMTIEELEKEYAKITEERQNLEKVLKQKKQDEEDRKIAQLAFEKEKRKKEVDEAFEKYYTLIKEYVRDYGSYSTTTSNTVDSKYLLNNPWAWWF